MQKGRIALHLGLLLSIGGCALVADLGDRTLADELRPGPDAARSDTGSSGGIDSGLDGSAALDGAPPGSVTGFSYHRSIALSSDAATPLVNHAVLVVLPSSFNYAHAKPLGEDIRFSKTPNHADDLSYFIEKWAPGAESLVWIKVADVPIGASTIHMFYGQAAAADQSSFATAFPNANRTAGAGAGSFTATGDINVDWFELRTGDTITLASGTPLAINARRIIIAGTIEGTGRGHAGGALNAPGSGAGAGGFVAGEGGGGGGYGGAGGLGGADAPAIGGAAGAANGAATDNVIAMGSGGGSTDDRLGGAGGGSISLFGWKTTVTGTIRMNGQNGEGLLASGRAAGGGAGGGIILGASFLELAGGTLTANGGTGGECATAINDGGGGGGGGRIKLRRRASGGFSLATLMTASLGVGGTGGGTTAPGANGAVGSTHLDDASTFLKGVETTPGAEGPAP